MDKTPSLTPDAVAAVCRHMNEDHRDDALLICRHLAGVQDAVDAETVDVDLQALHFSVRDGHGGTRAVTVPFAAPVSARAEIRQAVVELYQRACAAAGMAPRGH